MRGLKTICLLFTSILILSGCTWVEAVRTTGPQDNTAGIRIPDVKPLLVVGQTVSVILVPNTNRGVALRFGQFLSKNKIDITLQQGMLASLTDDADSTPVPDAFLSALGQAAASGHSLLGAAFAAQASGSNGKLQIYDIQFSDNGSIVGLTPLIKESDLISVPAGVVVAAPEQQSNTNTNTPNPTPQPVPATDDATTKKKP